MRPIPFHIFCTYIHFYSHTSCEVRLNDGGSAFYKINFYSHTSCEVRRVGTTRTYNCYRFLLTHLMRGATLHLIFYLIVEKFLLTHLMRGATTICCQQFHFMQFLLTHLMRGATWFLHWFFISFDISTHTPHARCDTQWILIFLHLLDFYSHTSCEVRRFYLFHIRGIH